MKYLVAFSILHTAGSSISSFYLVEPGPVTEEVIERWRSKIRLEYEDMRTPFIIRVLSFQALQEDNGR